MSTKNYDVIEHTNDDVEHVTLATKPEPIPDNVVHLPGRDLTWLARDVMSTPYAEVRS